MELHSYRTRSINAQTADRRWIVVDAKGQTLGRLSSRLAFFLRGKHKASFTPHVACGDYVIVINAQDVKLTGTKWTGRQHLRHTGYPGGQRSATPQEIHAKNPTKLIEMAVKGMLPRNRLGRELFRALHVYPGAEHPHAAQQPTTVDPWNFHNTNG